MKKNVWKKSMALVLLVFAAALTTTACSGKKDQETSSKKTQNEYVYQPSFQDLDLDVDYINSVCFYDNSIYMYGSKWVENKKKGDGKDYPYFIKCDTDGSNLSCTELKGLKTNESVSSMLASDDKIRLVTSKYSYNKKTGEDKQSYFLHTVNEKGKITDTVELQKKISTSDEDEVDFYIDRSNTFIDRDTLYIASDQKIYTFSVKDGKKKKTYKSEKSSYIEAFFRTTDGKMYISDYSDEKTGVKEFDPETGNFGSLIDFGDYSIYNINIQNGEGNVVYINDSSKVYSFDLSTGTIKEEFSWINSDIDGDNVSAYYPLEEGKILAITSSYDDSESSSVIELVTLNKMKASEVTEKKTLRLYCNYLDYNVKNKIISYNKKNENYRIEVKDYSSYEDSSKQMNLDLTSGNIPDIVDVSYGLSMETLAKKGILTDLYSFMENDEDVKKENFLPSILSTLEIDGKLYAMGNSFSVIGLLGGKKNVGDREGWTVDEMIAAYEAMPEGTEFMQYESRQGFLQEIIYYQLDNYVDWTNGTVSFDSDDFVKLLDFSMNFPDQESMDYANMKSMPTLVKQGKLFLDTFSLWSPEYIELYTKLYKKQGGFSVLSYPSEDKSSKLIMNMDGTELAITQQCEDKEGAWDFVREFYTYEYQNKNDSGSFPTRKDVFEKKLERAMATEEYTDDDGTEVQPIESSYGYDDYEVELGPLSEEEAGIIRDMVDRIGYCATYNAYSSDVQDIVAEETEAFFKGDKTAKEVADIIQSRVNIYVSENS
jgi:ABC-type glycerol-3-phosphate transport system substrate-binding protein